MTRASRFPIAVLKETPSDAEIVSHQLMLRAGLIRRAASGVYTWLPMGMRVLNKVQEIVRSSMNRHGAMEVLMPVLNPGELWRHSGRWDDYGPDLMRLTDRHGREFCLGPTHEEIITDTLRQELHSHAQLPCNFYQIQTKFRDEVRPRFGVMRGREFIMKDAYSFHTSQECMDEGYQAMHDAYCEIFDRLGIDYIAVRADSGNIGGSLSHEFQMLAESGEDVIVCSDTSDYAANLEFAEALPPELPAGDGSESLERVATPGCTTIDDVCTHLNVPPERTIKILALAGSDDAPAVAVALRGDHSLAELKLARLNLGVAQPVQLLEGEALAGLGLVPGSIAPFDLPIPLVVDRDAAALSDFVCGAGAPDMHCTGVNWARDVGEIQVHDLRNVCEGEPSPDGSGKLVFRRGIEVGHIFQLGTKYSDALGLRVLGADGKPITPLMGCYGLGVTRVVAAAIEQNHDEQGIVWPQPMAPFHVVVVLLNPAGRRALTECAEALGQSLAEAGCEVLLEDTEERAGAKFASTELLGIPHRLVVSERNVEAGEIEYRSRSAEQSEQWPIQEAAQRLLRRLRT
ncbi:MAG: proline--tRNA ligase [Gammaproteobacteria bacterium AqS3]|nr:proline--tRNA ligase [Gammaproteobacteria bacterium AqS3]